MSLFKIKNNIPQNYISESRDFQLFVRILDSVQNSIKFDIDSITNILDTSLIPSSYINNLKNKLGFFTQKYYNDDVLRVALSAFPYIIKYKGSELGVVKCINTFLNALKLPIKYKINIYNEDKGYGDHIIRIGINQNNIDTTLLEDMLYYILPPGYFIEIYMYSELTIDPTHSIIDDKLTALYPFEYKNTSIRSETITNEGSEEIFNTKLKDNLYNTVGFTTIHNPNNTDPGNNDEIEVGDYEG